MQDRVIPLVGKRPQDVPFRVAGVGQYGQRLVGVRGQDHGESFRNLPIRRELRTEHMPDNPVVVDDLIKMPVNAT